MGNVLNNPIVTKETKVGQLTFENDKDVDWGVSSMQGWRLEQEDAHVAPQDDGCLWIQMPIRGVTPPNNWGELQDLISGHYQFAVQLVEFS